MKSQSRNQDQKQTIGDLTAVAIVFLAFLVLLWSV